MRSVDEIVDALAKTFGVEVAEGAVALLRTDPPYLHEVPQGDEAIVVASFNRSGVEVHLLFDMKAGNLLYVSCETHGEEVCAHIGAVLIEFEQPSSAGSPEKLPKWERTLQSVLAPPTFAGEDTDPGVGLFVSLIDPTAGRDRWSYGSRRDRFLGLRPAVRGARGTWIKQGAGWGQLDASKIAPQVTVLLAELLASQGADGNSYYYRPEWLPLDDFAGRGLWALLTELREAGVEFVSADKAQRPVEFSTEVARPRISAQSARKRVQVRAELVTGEDRIESRSVYRLGTPTIAVGRVMQAPAGERIIINPVSTPLSDQWWQLARRRDPVSIDGAGMGRFEQDYLPLLGELAPVESPDGSYAVPEPVPTRLVLTITQVDQQVNLAWRWSGPPKPDRSRRREIITALCAAADSEVAMLYPQGVCDAAPAERVLGSLNAALFVAEVLPRLRQVNGLEITHDSAVPDFRWAEAEPVVSISADAEDNDWFDLQVQVDLDGESVEFSQLYVALAADDPIFVLPGGRIFSLEGAQLDQLRAIIAEARGLVEAAPGIVRISRYQVDLWNELVESGLVAEQGKAWLGRARALADTAMLEVVEPPESLEADLRDYQRNGLAWLEFLRRNGLGGVLGDDMGLGKTLQVIAMIESARRENAEMAPFLVVAPTSVVGNWARECRRFAPDLRVVTVEATQARRGVPIAQMAREAQVVVTSYTLLRLEHEDYREQQWSGVIFDEAQQIKNHRSKGYVAARRLEAPFKLVVTGTPLENNLTELWSLTSLACPGLLGGESYFAEFYRAPIERDGDPQRLSLLQRRIRPFLLRRRKDEVAGELPPKQQQIRELALHPAHRRLYDLHFQRERQKVLGLLDDYEGNRFQVFRSLALLRQLAIDADLIDHNEDKSPPSIKAETLIELLSAAGSDGHKVLVFSQFTKFLTKVRDLAEKAGIQCAYLDGKTRNRAQVIEQFRSGEASAFFISLKAGGFGLNLVEADHVVLLDPWWNPATEAQAIDRAHRIGQTRPVMVYRFVATSTIEEKVLALSERKARLFADVMDGDGTANAAILTAEEIRQLVS